MHPSNWGDASHRHANPRSSDTAASRRTVTVLDVKNTIKIASLLVAGSLTTASCGGSGRSVDSIVAESTTTVPIAPTTILQFIQGRPELSTLAGLITTAGLSPELSGPTALTLFAPTNAAFAELGSAKIAELTANPTALRSLLLGHVIAGEVVYSDILEGTIDSLAGTTLTFALGKPVTVNNISIEDTDYRFTNGMVHLIDRVITTGS